MAPGGSALPEFTKRHKNSVIIASPFITSEVPVGLAVTLFSLSPKRVKNGLAPGPKTTTLERQNPRPVGLWALGAGLSKQSLKNELSSYALNPAIGGTQARFHLQTANPDPKAELPKPRAATQGLSVLTFS